ncbi:MAG: hypothetical protein SGPRY_013278, partial [Prymnesium sp.]
IRDWMPRDAAAAAMLAAQEKRSLDAFISTLQQEVSSLGQQIDLDFEIVGINLEEQSEAYARESRRALAARAEALLEELEAAAPPTFRQRRAQGAVPTQKSPFLSLGATVVVCGGSFALSSALMEDIRSAGYSPRRGMDSVPANFADPTLPASPALRRELQGAEALVLLCQGAVSQGLSPTFLTSVSRVLPHSLRRVLIVGPRGCERTLQPSFALANVLGSLDRQRAAEQAVATSAVGVKAVWTVLRARVEEPEANSAKGDDANSAPDASDYRGGKGRSLLHNASEGGRGEGSSPRDAEAPDMSWLASPVELGYGDVFSGRVRCDSVCCIAREALRREEVHNICFSLREGVRCSTARVHVATLVHSMCERVVW